MIHERVHGDYLLSDNPARLEVDAIHAYLTRSYWAGGIPRDIVARSLANSLCVGIYLADVSSADPSAPAPVKADKQVGLVRVISDYATFAYLCDVYVLEPHRGHGLAKAALRFTLAHPRLQGLRGWSLRTRDAHSLYAQFGFQPLKTPESSMALSDPEIYRRTTSK